MTEYYQIIAQIIPVLILTIGVQSVTLHKYSYSKKEHKLRENHIFAFMITMALLTFAEFISLKNIYQKNETPGSLILTSAALALSVVFISLDYISSLYGISKYAWQLMYIFILAMTFTTTVVFIYLHNGIFGLVLGILLLTVVVGETVKIIKNPLK